MRHLYTHLDTHLDKSARIKLDLGSRTAAISKLTVNQGAAVASWPLRVAVALPCDAGPSDQAVQRDSALERAELRCLHLFVQ